MLWNRKQKQKGDITTQPTDITQPKSDNFLLQSKTIKLHRHINTHNMEKHKHIKIPAHARRLLMLKYNIQKSARMQHHKKGDRK